MVTTLVNIANATIPVADGRSSLKVEDGSTADIMTVVLSCYDQNKEQLQAFAPYLKGRTIRDTCSNIWSFVKSNIAYREDPQGEQWVKTPARVWADKVCDCKSYSIFIASCLYNLGITATFRFVSFSTDPTPTHVYVVVPVRSAKGNDEIKMDCVLPSFNKEKTYTHKRDYCMSKISVISGTGTPTNPVVQLMADRIIEARNNGGWLSGERNLQYNKAIAAALKAQGKIAGEDGMPDNFGDAYQQANSSNASGAKSSGIIAAGIKNGLTIAKGEWDALFSKGGVSPDFFSRFSFLKFLDNSTGKWKSRFAAMKGMTPNERLSWYIDKFKEDGDVQTANQYTELFGKLHNETEGGGIDDTHAVSTSLARVWNALMYTKFGAWKSDGSASNICVMNFGGNPCHRVLDQFLIWEQGLPDYADFTAAEQGLTNQVNTLVKDANGNAINPPGLTAGMSNNTWLMLGLGGAALYMFARK